MTDADRTHRSVMSPKVLALFVVFWSWQTVLTFAPTFAGHQVGVSLLWTVSSLCSLVASVTALAFWRVVQTHIGSRRFLFATAAGLEAGTLGDIALVVFVGSPSVWWHYALYAVSGLVLSAGVILTDLLLIRLLANCRQESGRALIVMAATVLKLLLYLLFDNLSNPLVYIALLLAPLAIGYLLAAKGVIAILGATPEPASTNSPSSARSPLGLFFILAALSLSINFMRRQVTDDAGSEFDGSSIIASTLFLVVAAFAIEYVAQRRGLSTTPLVISLYLAVSLFLGQTARIGIPGGQTPFVFAAFFLFITMLYRLTARYACADDGTFMRTAALMFVGNSLGRIAGELLWMGREALPSDPVVLAYLVSTATMFMFALMQNSDANKLEFAGSIRTVISPENSAGATTSDIRSFEAELERGIDRICVRYALTKAERSVLSLTVRGLTYSRIAEELGLSPNTIKAHLRKIYSKTSCHSAEELFRLLVQN